MKYILPFLLWSNHSVVKIKITNLVLQCIMVWNKYEIAVTNMGQNYSLFPRYI